MWFSKISQSNLVRSASWMVVASFVNSLLRFLLVFILLRLYSQEEFGLWASVTSIAAILITGDFGITNVLRNRASKSIENDDESSIREAFFSSVYFFVTFAIIVSILLVLLSPYIPYENLFKTDDASLKEQGRLLFIGIQILFLFGIPFSLGCNLFFSFNESKCYSIVSFLQGVLTFLVVLLLACLNFSVGVVSISYFMINTIVYLVGSCWFLKKRKWHFQTLPISVVCKNMKEMLPVGFKFLSVQLSSSFIFNLLTLYSGAFLGLSVAANINVVQKIYTFLTGIYQSINNPLWGALASGFFANNYKKCRVILARSLFLSFVVFSILIFGSFLFRDFLVHIIAGSTYRADGTLFILVGLYFMVKVMFDNASLLQNATNKLNVLVIGYLVFDLFALVCIPSIVKNYGIQVMLISIIALWGLFTIIMLINSYSILRYGKN